MKKIRLRTINIAIFAFFGTGAVIVLGLIMVYSELILSNISANWQTKELTNNSAAQSKLVNTEINKTFQLARQLAELSAHYKSVKQNERRDYFNHLLSKTLEGNNSAIGVWMVWEPMVLDSLDNSSLYTQNKTSGRFIASYYKFKNFIGQENINIDKENIWLQSDQYLTVKSLQREVIIEPSRYSYTGDNRDEVWRISIAVPIFSDGIFVGVVGFDLPVLYLKQLISTSNTVYSSYSFILSDNGQIVAHPEERNLNVQFPEMYKSVNQRHKIVDRIPTGYSFQFTDKIDFNQENQHISVVPFPIGNTGRQWALVYVVSSATYKDLFQNQRIVFYLLSGMGVILSMLLAFFLSKRLVRPLNQINSTLLKVSEGDILHSKLPELNVSAEMQLMVTYISRIIEGMRRTTYFAKEIGSGNLDAQYEVLSEKDALGNALLEMRNELKEAELKEKVRRQDDEIRNWTNLGLSKFSDLLRKDTNDINKLTHNIISQLVRYLEAIQGGVFLMQNENKREPYLDLIAAFAYDRKKYLQRQVKLKEGLVGMCAVEGDVIHLTNLPDDYLAISSGLGESSPKNLLIVPLKYDNNIVGVLEIASLLDIEQFKIDFVVKLAESIALTISSVLINQRTVVLLQQSKKQSEELASQEEEMRQNLEELQATQEESARKEFKMQGLILAIENAAFTYEFNTFGSLIEISNNTLKLLEVSREILLGINHPEFCELEDYDEVASFQFWNDLKAGIVKNVISKNKVSKEPLWMRETYTPLYDSDGNFYKVMVIATNITEYIQFKEDLMQKTHELQISNIELQSYHMQLQHIQTECGINAGAVSAFMEALQSNTCVAIFDKSGNILEINDLMLKTYQLSREIVGKNIRNYTSISDSRDFENFWNELQNGKSQYRSFELVLENKVLAMQEVYTPVLDKSNVLHRVLNLCWDKTNEIQTLKQFEAYRAEAEKKEKQLIEKMELLKETAEFSNSELDGLDGIMSALGTNLMLSEYDMETNLISMSQPMMNLLELEEKDLKKKMHKDLAVIDNFLKYHVLWSKIRTGVTQQRQYKYEFKNKTFYFSEYYIPILNKNEEVHRIVVVSFDITAFKIAEINYKKAIEELRSNKSN